MNRFKQSVVIVVILGVALVAAVVWAMLPAAKAEQEVTISQAAIPVQPMSETAFFAANPELLKANRSLAPAGELQPSRLDTIQHLGLAEVLAAEEAARLRANQAVAGRYTGLAEALAAEEAARLRANQAIADRYTGMAEALAADSMSHFLAHNPELLIAGRYAAKSSQATNPLADNPELISANRYEPQPTRTYPLLTGR